jgi:hypothetical protein
MMTSLAGTFMAAMGTTTLLGYELSYLLFNHGLLYPSD